MEYILLTLTCPENGYTDQCRVQGGRWRAQTSATTLKMVGPIGPSFQGPRSNVSGGAALSQVLA